MPDLDFEYDEDLVVTSDDIPDMQVNPLIPGSAIPLRKVGIAPVDLPIRLLRRDGTEQTLQATASLYASLDDPKAKGLNLSRFYLLMHDAIKDQLSHDGLMAALKMAAEKQGATKAWCKLRFKYPWIQKSLRSNKEGYIAYKCSIEGVYMQRPQYRLKVDDKATSLLSLNDQDKGKKILVHPEQTEIGHFIDDYKFYLTVEYMYSSTCPCSFELAHHAKTKRNKAANAHSQRSIAKITVEYDPTKPIWIEDVVELARKQIPTEVQVVVKRIDEQAFAELNGSNLLFAEDACRILYGALDEWYDAQKIRDFSIVIEHIESLHPWSAIAVTSKFDPQYEQDVLA